MGFAITSWASLGRCTKVERITLMEYESRARSAFPGRSLESLQALDEQGKIAAIDWSRRLAVKARSWVGTMQVPGCCVDILPKTGFADVPATRIQQRLLGMLATAGMIPVEDRDISMVTTERSRLWDCVAAGVAKRLMRALMAGVPRSYQRIDDDQPVIRGRLRTEILVRQCPPRLERPPITYDELTTDIPLTRLLRDLARRLYRSVSAPAALQATREPWSLLEATAGDWDTSQSLPELDRGNERFRPFLAFYQLLISGRTTGTGSGNDQTFSLLFPMERVFEGYIAGLLRRHANRLGGKRLMVQGGRKRAWLARDVYGSGVGRLKPDLAIADPYGNASTIIDTKWKVFDMGLPGPADLYQMNAYAAHWGCRDNLLLLPAQGHEAGQHLILNHDDQTAIRVGYVDINQPDGDVMTDLLKLTYLAELCEAGANISS